MNIMLCALKNTSTGRNFVGIELYIVRRMLFLDGDTWYIGKEKGIDAVGVGAFGLSYDMG